MSDEGHVVPISRYGTRALPPSMIFFSPDDASAPHVDADANYQIRFLFSLRLLPQFLESFSVFNVELFWPSTLGLVGFAFPLVEREE